MFPRTKATSKMEKMYLIDSDRDEFHDEDEEIISMN